MLLVRRVVGKSMLPTLRPKSMIIAWTRPARIVPGDVVIVRHDNMEKVKRVQRIEDGRVYVVGDHAAFSTDSRHFGWLDRSVVIAKVWWPRTARLL